MKKLTTEQFINKAIKIHNNKYDYSLVNYINTKTKIKIICPIHGIFEQTPTKHIHNKRGCPICGGSKKLTNRQFINKAIKIHNNKYNYSLVNYINTKTKIKIICPIHGIFKQTPNNHIIKKYGCPSCSNNKSLNTISFINRVKKIHNNKYDYSLVNYINAHTKVKIICPIHGVFEQTPNSHYQNIGCSKCHRSKGEEQIESILLKNNINFKTQKKFENCKDKRKLPFDFYLPKYNLCIEYDGEQHFKIFNNFWGGISQLSITQKHDQIKNKFCKENNINLLRIKYNENIENKLKKELNKYEKI